MTRIYKKKHVSMYQNHKVSCRMTPQLIASQSSPSSLSSFSSSSIISSPISSTTSTTTKTKTPLSLSSSKVTNRYRRVTPTEHVLLRPGMYVGSVECQPPLPIRVLNHSPPPPLISSSSPKSSLKMKNSNNPKKNKNDNSIVVPTTIVQKDLSLHPALIKIFDEILVNAMDNRHRHIFSSSERSTSSKNYPKKSHLSALSPPPQQKMTRLNVTIDRGCSKSNRYPTICITNDGPGLPVRMHPIEKMYVPQLVFGHLLTGSNLGHDDDNNDDDDSSGGNNNPTNFVTTNKRVNGKKRNHPNNNNNDEIFENKNTENDSTTSILSSMTGGRHGYGAKLTNIFSKKFQIETVDGDVRKGYKQIWTNNMGNVSLPTIWDCNQDDDKDEDGEGGGGDDDEVRCYTSVSFVPDLKRLCRGGGAGSSANNDGKSNAIMMIPEDDYAVMCRRMYDVAGCCSGQGIVVTLNNTKIPVNSFEDYAALYYPNVDQKVGGDGNNRTGDDDDDDDDDVDNYGPTSSSLRYTVYPKDDENDRPIAGSWEVVVGPAPLSSTTSNKGNSNNSINAASVSFVNGVCTSGGGTHVDAITDIICSYIGNHVRANHPEWKDESSSSSSLSSSALSKSMIRRKMLLFINASVPNPGFDSQSKERLTSHPDSFFPGSQQQLSPNSNGKGGFRKKMSSTLTKKKKKKMGKKGDDDNPIRYLLHEKFLASLVQPIEDGGPGIIEEVIRAARGRRHSDLLRIAAVSGQLSSNATQHRIRRRLRIDFPKLDDAHLAGHPTRARECTLILTEGDSAKALAVAGLEVFGRNKYGVFPLRGKFLNVRGASPEKLAGNVEVRALCAILGLDLVDVLNRAGIGGDVDREEDAINGGGSLVTTNGNRRSYLRQKERDAHLRYGHVMIMTDQDEDGSHIKGLVVNFFRHFWPELLLPPVIDENSIDDNHSKCEVGSPFLSSFATPLVKAKRKKRRRKKKGNSSSSNDNNAITENELSFFSSSEYERWKGSISSEELQKDWTIKYYKGLGTSTRDEAIEYFSNFDKHHRPFRWVSEGDGQLLDMAFDRDRAEDRREWIEREYNPLGSGGDHIDSIDGNRDEDDVDRSVTYGDFVNHELVNFSNSDNVRSIPSVVDGLKPSQRKVLFACFDRKLFSDEIKVAQLGGYCAEHTAYHHGEASLHSTS